MVLVKKMATVFNQTREIQIHYPGMSPEEAVRRAFMAYNFQAESRRQKHEAKIRRTKRTVSAGEWTAFL